MKKNTRKKVDPEVRAQVREIMRGRKEERNRKKDIIRTGDWEDIIPLISEEDAPDISAYRRTMEKAGITIEALREIALHSRARIKMMQEPGSIEISFRKADHSAVTVISEDGKMNTMMKDFLDY